MCRMDKNIKSSLGTVIEFISQIFKFQKVSKRPNFEKNNRVLFFFFTYNYAEQGTLGTIGIGENFSQHGSTHKT